MMSIGRRMEEGEHTAVERMRLQDSMSLLCREVEQSFLADSMNQQDFVWGVRKSRDQNDVALWPKSTMESLTS